jgi:hypothetical protein
MFISYRPRQYNLAKLPIRLDSLGPDFGVKNTLSASIRQIFRLGQPRGPA